MKTTILDILISMEKFLLNQLYPLKSEAILSVTDYFNDLKTRASDLVNGILAGELSTDFVMARIKEEKTNLYAEVLTLAQLGESEAESLVNNVMELFESFLNNLTQPK